MPRKTMPRKTKTPKKTRRRRYKKNASMYALSKPSPLPQSYKFMTRYVATEVEINPGVGGLPASYVWSMNGLYDPDITSGGHQVIGFDEIMPLYDHYCVIGSRIRVNATNTDTVTAQDIALQLKDVSTISTDFQGVLENGNAKWTTLSPLGTGGSTRSLTVECSPTKFFTAKVMQDDKYKGTVSSNPSDQVYCHMIVNPIVASDTSAVVCTVEIEYIAILSEPKQIARS